MTTRSKVSLSPFMLGMNKELRGAKVVLIRNLMPEEISLFGWDSYDAESSFIMLFDNGKAVVAMRDPEGNGPGFLEVTDVG